VVYGSEDERDQISTGRFPQLDTKTGIRYPSRRAAAEAVAHEYSIDARDPFAWFLIVKRDPSRFTEIILQPHTQDIELPTTGQLRYIASLCMRLGKETPYVETMGEAGRLIRELEDEDAYRRKQGRR